MTLTYAISDAQTTTGYEQNYVEPILTSPQVSEPGPVTQRRSGNVNPPSPWRATQCRPAVNMNSVFASRGIARNTSSHQNRISLMPRQSPKEPVAFRIGTMEHTLCLL
jgi:hypothetical protein